MVVILGIRIVEVGLAIVIHIRVRHVRPATKALVHHSVPSTVDASTASFLFSAR